MRWATRSSAKHSSTILQPRKWKNSARALRADWAERTIADHKAARTTLRELIASAKDAFGVRVPTALVIECACGACSGLDEYTIFLTPNAGAEGATIPTSPPPGCTSPLRKNALVIDGIVPHSWVALNYPHLKRGRITR